MVRSKRLAFLFTLIAAAYLFAGDCLLAANIDWKPVTPDELRMTGVPQAPDAAAVCLFSETFTDDVTGREHRYVRIKVLTEAGRSQGNVRIPYVKGYFDIKDLRVRTIQPDGKITENPITPVDSVIFRYRKIKTYVKTLALPEISPGTIIEYQYDYEWDRQYLHSNPWVVDEDLFTVRASFARHINRSANCHYYSSRLPAGVRPQFGVDGFLHMELSNVPAVETEQFMPPTAETRPRVDFYYYLGAFMDKDLDATWPLLAKGAQESIARYLSKDQGLDRFLQETVKTDDGTEVKLRKLYDRVQSMRNLSFVMEKDRAQYEREKLKFPETVADVIKRGYGFQGDLDILYLALMRRAGFQAWLLDVANRDGEMFFDPRSLTIADLPGRAVLVRANDKDYFLDPGTPLLPFGFLPWGETSVRALKLDVASGGFVTTPDIEPPQSTVDCNAKFALGGDGALQGTLTVTYSGLEAFNRRMEARELDEVARGELLESELQGWIPGTSEVQLQSKPEWLRADPTLVAEFSVRIKDWAIVTPGRLLFPEGIFSGEERQAFVSARRVHDLYFPFPYEKRSVIYISLPRGYRVESVPDEKDRDLTYLSYQATVQKEEAGVKISRRLALARTSLPVTTYGAVFAFYQDLRSADESQMVLKADATGTVGGRQ